MKSVTANLPQNAKLLDQFELVKSMLEQDEPDSAVELFAGLQQTRQTLEELLRYYEAGAAQYLTDKIVLPRRFFFINHISIFYPFTEKLIDRFGDLLNQAYLQRNINLLFNPNEAGKYANKQENEDWAWLAKQGYLTEAFIDRFQGHLFGYYHTLLSANENVEWTESLLTRYQHKLEWEAEGLSSVRTLPWSDELINKFQNRWAFHALAQNGGVPWSEDILNACTFQTQTEAFNTFEKRRRLLMDFINQPFKYLSHQRNVIWSESLLEAHAADWDWEALSKNPSLPFTIGLLKRFENRWRWDLLAQNRGVWTQAFAPAMNDRVLERILEVA